MSRIARIASTALLTAGLVVLLDVGITLAWGEPVSTVRGWLAQRDASEELERLEREFRPPPDAPLRPRAVRRSADRLAREAERGKAIGRLEIAAIDLNIVVVEGTDTESLRRGPGHYPETAFPGQPGTVAIAGHRTTYLAPFRRIDEIGRGDELRLEMPYATFTYRFERQRIVDPSRVGVVRDVDHDRLVLTACHPLYSAAQRIVVFARLVRVEPPGEAGDGPGAPVRRETDEIEAPGPGPALAGLGGLVGIAALMWLVSGRRGAGPR
jgi:sortase A